MGGWRGIEGGWVTVPCDRGGGSTGALAPGIVVGCAGGCWRVIGRHPPDPLCLGRQRRIVMPMPGDSASAPLWNAADYAEKCGTTHRAFDDWFLRRHPVRRGDEVVDLGLAG